MSVFRQQVALGIRQGAIKSLLDQLTILSGRSPRGSTDLPTARRLVDFLRRAAESFDFYDRMADVPLHRLDALTAWLEGKEKGHAYLSVCSEVDQVAVLALQSGLVMSYAETVGDKTAAGHLLGLRQLRYRVIASAENGVAPDRRTGLRITRTAKALALPVTPDMSSADYRRNLFLIDAVAAEHGLVPLIHADQPEWLAKAAAVIESLPAPWADFRLPPAGKQAVGDTVFEPGSM